MQHITFFSLFARFFSLAVMRWEGRKGEMVAGVLGVGMVCTGSFRSAFFGCVFFLLLS